MAFTNAVSRSKPVARGPCLSLAAAASAGYSSMRAKSTNSSPPRCQRVLRGNSAATSSISAAAKSTAAVRVMSSA